MKRKPLTFSLVGILILGLILGGAKLLIGASPHPPDKQKAQEVSRTVQDFYNFLGDLPVWPAKYRHLRKIPDDIKNEIAKRNKARAGELTAGRLYKGLSGVSQIFSNGFEPYNEQQIGGGMTVVDLEDLEQVGDKISVNAVVWSWSQIASTKDATLPVLPEQVPKSDIVYVDKLVLQEFGGKWKVVERSPMIGGLSGPFGDLREVDPIKYGKKPKFGAPTPEEAKRLYKKAKLEGHFKS